MDIHDLVIDFYNAITKVVTVGVPTALWIMLADSQKLSHLTQIFFDQTNSPQCALYMHCPISMLSKIEQVSQVDLAHQGG